MSRTTSKIVILRLHQLSALFSDHLAKHHYVGVLADEKADASRHGRELRSIYTHDDDADRREHGGLQDRKRNNVDRRTKRPPLHPFHVPTS